MVTTLSPGDLQTYEMLYIGFCGVLISFFLIVLYSIYVEGRVLRRSRPNIIKKVTEHV